MTKTKTIWWDCFACSLIKVYCNYQLLWAKIWLHIARKEALLFGEPLMLSKNEPEIRRKATAEVVTDLDTRVYNEMCLNAACYQWMPAHMNSCHSSYSRRDVGRGREEWGNRLRLCERHALWFAPSRRTPCGRRHQIKALRSWQVSYLWGCSRPWLWPALPASAARCTWSQPWRGRPPRWIRGTRTRSSPHEPKEPGSGPGEGSLWRHYHTCGIAID